MAEQEQTFDEMYPAIARTIKEEGAYFAVEIQEISPGHYQKVVGLTKPANRPLTTPKFNNLKELNEFLTI